RRLWTHALPEFSALWRQCHRSPRFRRRRPLVRHRLSRLVLHPCTPSHAGRSLNRPAIRVTHSFRVTFATHLSSISYSVMDSSMDREGVSSHGEANSHRIVSLIACWRLRQTND